MEIIAGNIAISQNDNEIVVWEQLLKFFDKRDGLIGYKYPSLGITDQNLVPTFVVISKEHGVLLIDVVQDEVESIFEGQEHWILKNKKKGRSHDILLDNFSVQLEHKLSVSSKLFDRKKRQLNIPVEKLLVFTANSKAEIQALESQLISTPRSYENPSDLEDYISTLTSGITEESYRTILSLLEGAQIVPSQPDQEGSPRVTKSDYIRDASNTLLLLDKVQRQVAVQIPNGPQRVRGLAGTGKTIILCWKAAFGYAKNKNWKILFLFNTQSLYNLISNSIRQYYFKEAGEILEDGAIDILHAWGSQTRRGLYTTVCESVGLKPRTYDEVRSKDDPHNFIFEELLKQKHRFIEYYDLVLIDEAQDFGPAVFETIYHITKSPKRIVWAYDEFQSLKELSIREPSNLFGSDNGEPNMHDDLLRGQYPGGIDKDFVLPNSYRNSRYALMVAHGVGLGLFSERKVPMRDKRSWEARGYRVIEPQKEVFDHHDQVKIERPEEHSRNKLEQLLKSDNISEKTLVTFKEYKSEEEEIDYVVRGIKKLINEDQVLPEQILVISLSTRHTKAKLDALRSRLSLAHIRCLTPGMVERSDQFIEANRVTLSTPFRAKGNEAFVVFVINAQSVDKDYSFRARNSFFVAVTRSKGWCFISTSSAAPRLREELRQISYQYPQFNFEFPDPHKMEELQKIISATDSKKQEFDDVFELNSSDPVFIAAMQEFLAKNPKYLPK